MILNLLDMQGYRNKRFPPLWAFLRVFLIISGFLMRLTNQVTCLIIVRRSCVSPSPGGVSGRSRCPQPGRRPSEIRSSVVVFRRKSVEGFVSSLVSLPVRCRSSASKKSFSALICLSVPVGVVDRAGGYREFFKIGHFSLNLGQMAQYRAITGRSPNIGPLALSIKWQKVECVSVRIALELGQPTQNG